MPTYFPLRPHLLSPILLVSSPSWAVGDLGSKDTSFDSWNRTYKRSPSEPHGIVHPSKSFLFLNCVCLSLASASQNHPTSRQCLCMCAFPELLLSEVPHVLPPSQEEGVPWSLNCLPCGFCLTQSLLIMMMWINRCPLWESSGSDCSGHVSCSICSLRA